MQNLGEKFMWAAKSGEPDPESNRALKVVLERAKHTVFQNIL